MYEVGTSLGSYLLALGAAEPVLDKTPAKVVPVSTDRAEQLGRSPFRNDLSQAADSSSRKR